MGCVRNALKKTWYAVFPNRPSAYLGRVVVKLLPESYQERVRREFFTAKGPSGLLADAVRAEINRQHYAAPDEQEFRRRSRELFWGAEAGKKWHELGRDRYRDSDAYQNGFHAPRAPLVLQLAAFLDKNPAYRTICEIGTGHGLFLQLLSDKLPAIERFIGLDLNREQILENRRTYSDPRMEFICGEVLEWIRQRDPQPTVFVACETFEFFSQQELAEFFQFSRDHLGQVAVGIFALNEPGWSSLEASRTRGSTAYSHNFPLLLDRAGYGIVSQDIRRAGPYDRICLLAVSS